MLKIDKKVPLGPKKHFKKSQKDELIEALNKLDHMHSVFIPHDFLGIQSVRAVTREVQKKWGKNWELDTRVYWLGKIKGCRVWAINHPTPDAKKTTKGEE